MRAGGYAEYGSPDVLGEVIETSLPAGTGIDAAGTVDEVGNGVQGPVETALRLLDQVGVQAGRRPATRTTAGAPADLTSVDPDT